VGIGTTVPSGLLDVYRTGVGLNTQLNIFSDASVGSTTNTATLNLKIKGTGGGTVDNSYTSFTVLDGGTP
jgi:hypothetical protein